MASTPKQVNGPSATTESNNGLLGKRKKSRSSKGSYLSKWLDKTMNHIPAATPSGDTFDTYVAHVNWPNSSQFAPGFESYRYHMYGPEPASMPSLPSYYNPMPYFAPECRYVQNVNQSVQVQRPRRRRNENKAEEVHSLNATPNSTINNYFQPKTFTDSQDFASLPPIVTSVADTNSNSDVNTNEKDDNGNTRRFSDPCVRGLPDVAQRANGDMESDSEASSGLSGSQIGSRLLTCLLDQIASLKMVNERLNKDLLDTKAELESVRQQNMIFHKTSSPSLGATPNHSPLNGNENSCIAIPAFSRPAMAHEYKRGHRVRALTTCFDAPGTDNAWSRQHFGENFNQCEVFSVIVRLLENNKVRVRWDIDGKYSNMSVHDINSANDDIGVINGQYSPGFLTDLVREIRDAARVREEAMYARMRTMMLERNDSSLGSIDTKSLEKSLEDIKSSLRASEADKRRMMDRIAKLEDELRTMRLTNGITEPSEAKLTNGSSDDADSERVRLRKELADAKKAKQNAEDHALKLERLVTQLRSKFNGVQIPNGPDSLPSEPEHEPSVRARRTSANSSSSTVVFGPVTDL